MDWLDEGYDSPWGNVESVEEIAAGIWWIETDCHGGVSLDEERLSKVPQAWRDNLFAGDGWFEEDRDWVLAAALFPHAFPELPWTKIAETFEDSFPEYDLPNPPDGEGKQELAPYQVGELLDPSNPESRIKHVEQMAEGIWFIGLETEGFWEVSEKIIECIPEPWKSNFPGHYGGGDGWIDWQLPKKRGRKKAA